MLFVIGKFNRHIFFDKLLISIIINELFVKIHFRKGQGICTFAFV